MQYLGRLILKNDFLFIWISNLTQCLVFAFAFICLFLVNLATLLIAGALGSHGLGSDHGFPTFWLWEPLWGSPFSSASQGWWKDEMITCLAQVTAVIIVPGWDPTARRRRASTHPPTSRPRLVSLLKDTQHPAQIPPTRAPGRGEEALEVFGKEAFSALDNPNSLMTGESPV